MIYDHFFAALVLTATKDQIWTWIQLSFLDFITEYIAPGKANPKAF